MQDETIFPRLELRTRKGLNLIYVILYAGFLGYVAWDMRSDLFKWKDSSEATLIFLLLLSVGIIGSINIFDKRPHVIIDNEGIWIRKYPLPFSPLVLINWKEIQSFYFLERGRNKRTEYLLMISKKEKEKEIKVTLTLLDRSIETILSLVRQYAQKYGIHDFGEKVA